MGAIPTFVAKNTAQASVDTATQITLEKPPGTVQNDVMVIGVMSSDAEGLTNNGWEQLGTGIDIETGSSQETRVFWKRAGASEAGSYVVSQTNPSRMAGIILTIRGCRTTGNPFIAYDLYGPVKNKKIDATDKNLALNGTYRGVLALALGFELATGAGSGLFDYIPVDEAPYTQRHRSLVNDYRGVLAATRGYSSVATVDRYYIRWADTNDAHWHTSALIAFTSDVAPTAPTLTFPNGGETIVTPDQTITWTEGTDADQLASHLKYDVELSVDGGNTWGRLTTTPEGAVSFDYDFGDIAATTTARVRVRTRDGANQVSAWDESASNFSIVMNSAPNAPTLQDPGNNTTKNLAAGYTFRWQFNDSDAGDYQTAWYMRRKVGAGAYQYFNVATGNWQAGEVKNAGLDEEYTFAASKWTNGTQYNWSVATEDSQGYKGPYAPDLLVNAQSPAALTVTAPVGSVTTSNQPVVSWAFTDAANNPQQTYRVKVFSAAQYGAGGFDPATSTPTWDSTEVTSVTARNTQVGTTLTNSTTYRAYMRVKVNGLYSAWVYSEFTINLTVPTAPTIVTAVNDSTTSSNVLTLNGTASGPFDYNNTLFYVEYSDDNGITWSAIRDAFAIPDSSFNAEVVDYEAPLNFRRAYRASAVNNEDRTLQSLWSEATDVDNTATEWWLKDPAAPEDNMIIYPTGEHLALHKKEDIAKFNAIGRANPVPVRDIIHGVDGAPLHLDFVTEEAFQQFERLRNKQKTLLLQAPMYGHQWYISFDSDMEERIIATEDPYRQVNIEWFEVDKP